jgi:hypothetical protein
MVAMTSSTSSLRKKVSGDKSGRAGRAFVAQVSGDYPQFSFKKGTQEHWSPKAQSIMYNPAQSLKRLRYGVLHELSHALLDHTDYKSDFELLKLEAMAWELAAQIGKKYGVIIDDEHIQNCLDTYRDWLHRRSTCPSCEVHVLQDSPSSYRCYNCGESWQVSSGRFVRSYRKKVMRKI